MTRIEKDSLGRVKVPSEAYFGAQTQRAVENFPISGLRQYEEFIKVYALLKKAASIANMKLRRLERKKGNAIVKAAEEVMTGKLRGEFVVDVFQAGGGTSTNMNLNEVIANRAEELLGGRKGTYRNVHPNDQVNMSQSTNDTYHTVTHIVVYQEIASRLIPALKNLQQSFEKKSREFSSIIKTGRTHLQDAMPLSLGQEFSGYASAISHGIQRLEGIIESLRELAIGGTAVGTGVNSPKGYGDLMVREISRLAGVKFRKSKNFFNALQNQNVEAEVSGALRTVAISLNKISSDFILLSSGPNAGLGEIILPPVQPGSSIMPGKINPSIPEMVNMVCFRVIGNDLTVAEAARAGQLDLNVYLPIIAYCLIDSSKLLTQAVAVFEKKCVRGVKANKKRIQEQLEKNPIIATALSPYIGYEKAAEVVSIAYKKGVSIREVVLQKKLLSKKKLDKILDYRKLVNP